MNSLAPPLPRCSAGPAAPRYQRPFLTTLCKTSLPTLTSPLHLPIRRVFVYCLLALGCNVISSRNYIAASSPTTYRKCSRNSCRMSDPFPCIFTVTIPLPHLPRPPSLGDPRRRGSFPCSKPLEEFLGVLRIKSELLRWPGCAPLPPLSLLQWCWSFWLLTPRGSHHRAVSHAALSFSHSRDEGQWSAEVKSPTPALDDVGLSLSCASQQLCYLG